MSNALERGLHVLQILSERGDARVSEVGQELGVSRATAFRIMRTLEDRNYVENVGERHAWRLGPAIHELAASLDSNLLTRLAAPALAELRATTRETVNLAVLRRNRIVWAASFEGAHALRLSTTIGEDVPAHATAVGKAILALLPDQEWDLLLPTEPFPTLTARTHTTREALEPDVEACRRLGYALDEEESEASGVCVAAPIAGRDGRPVAAISVSSVSGRLPPDARGDLGQAVAGWCVKISEAFAGAGASAEDPVERLVGTQDAAR